MIVSFRDRGTEDLYHQRSTKAARKTLPSELWPVARRKLDYIRFATRLGDLRMPPSNRIHPLARDRAGQHAIRINDQWRICFTWTDRGAEEVEITDYH